MRIELIEIGLADDVSKANEQVKEDQNFLSPATRAGSANSH
jgi:hypothetical protein